MNFSWKLNQILHGKKNSRVKQLTICKFSYSDASSLLQSKYFLVKRKEKPYVALTDSSHVITIN